MKKSYEERQDESLYMSKCFECYDKVLKYFNNDHSKTDVWFYASNGNFGGLSAHDLIHAGKVDKLMLFIDESLEED